MISEKFVKKYMRLAKQFGEDSNPCYSRKIGVIIVDPTINKIVATGYNGPPRGTPHCDSEEHLKNIVYPQLTSEDKKVIGLDSEEDFLSKYSNCGSCPRKIIKADSGKRLELCSCAHAEVNAIVNASQKLHDCVMFCWCPVPCIECTKIIINSGIKELWCFKEDKDYSVGSRYLFDHAKVKVNELEKNHYETLI